MKKKKLISFVVSFMLILSAGTGSAYGETSSEQQSAAQTATFSDISGHWAENIIKEAASLKIVGGYMDGTYLPDNLIKREEFYKLLTNILTVTPDIANTKVNFTDVLDYEWYVPTIKIAVAAGITSGYEDGTFGIGLMISRQEAAKVAGSVIPGSDDDSAKGVETALDKGNIAAWAYPYVDLMFKKGYMKGDTEGNFRPTMALTRAEAAAILLNVKKNESVIAANAEELTLTGCSQVHSVTQGAFTKGEGTRNDPYQIATEEQLNHIRMHVTEGAFYILTKDIAITKDFVTAAPAIASGEDDWSAGNFQPIGSKAIPFKGCLDGDGHTISGLNITGTVGGSKGSGGSGKPAASYAGLFGYVGQGGSVEDLTINSSSITGNQYTGSIAGYTEGTIKNCRLGSKGTVNGSTNTGGIVGFSTATLTSLKNQGTVTGKSANTGGIAGAVNAPGTALISCQNEGTVNGNERTGGIVGSFASAAGESSVIKECYNKGTVNAGPYNAGGIAGAASGSNYSIQIESCGNSGTVTGSGVNGGIAGLLETSKATVTQSQNSGTVAGNGAGGIVGNNQGIISYCYNSGTVEANLDGGGIAAYQQNGMGKISKCYNEGKVTAKSFAGGITGENESKIDNSYNSGKINGTNYIGGIAGKNLGTITNVYGAGKVTGENGAGSLVGRNAAALSNSFWLDTTGTAGVGLSDGTASQQLVKKVTHEELSGQTRIKTSNGYELVVDVMNANNKTSADVINKTEPAAVWKYLYSVTSGSTGGNTVISDGGGIVAPIEVPSDDSTGNTIASEDLETKYLYPAIIL
ncbi:S-layer homology domain-containing protein [Sinanaerobacter chloroacetimidivorans]|uniref:S-layer homology domain-containing protein n=1 Tax=Sinanaerobacter chloroacetimidivorans TaxID=2818044 RepID=A0A8J8B2Y7_9FIRM|nr:S-layer homology domain-containing protein [Sinanaerobacter chloroacetimidivorans]MBR0599197.1 S-layer homology domain-containing protein [Sinanaerobacter chloroacetimidivorans]